MQSRPIRPWQGRPAAAAGFEPAAALGGKGANAALLQNSQQAFPFALRALQDFRRGNHQHLKPPLLHITEQFLYIRAKQQRRSLRRVADALLLDQPAQLVGRAAAGVALPKHCGGVLGVILVKALYRHCASPPFSGEIICLIKAMRSQPDASVTVLEPTLKIEIPFRSISARNSYGDITRHFVKHSIKVYDKALQRGFISKLLRNPVYVQADMDIYEYYKAQGVKIESPPEMFTGDNSCYLYQGREGEEQILVIAPHQGRISSQLWLTVQRKLSQNTSFQNGRKCHNTWLAGKIKCGRCGYALAALRAQNGVTYLRCKQRAENGSCEGAGTLTAQSMEAFVYGEMVKKMQKFHTLKGGKEQSYNPKLTAARVALAKTESEIEKLLDTLSGANPLLLQYANNRIEELDAERQKQLRLVADLTANSVSASQIDSITGYLDDWESVSFDDKRKVVDILISQIDATRKL